LVRAWCLYYVYMVDLISHEARQGRGFEPLWEHSFRYIFMYLKECDIRMSKKNELM